MRCAEYKNIMLYVLKLNELEPGIKFKGFMYK